MRITRRAFIPALAGTGVLASAAVASAREGTLLRQATPIADGTPESGEMGTVADVTIYELPGDAVYPEGVTFDAATNSFYVGSTGTGTIYRGDITTGEVEVFVEASNDGTPFVTGMAVDQQGFLWVCGADSGIVSIYDTTTGNLIGQADNGLAPNTFLNDVAISRDGRAFVTDSVAPQVLILSATLDAGASTDGVFDLTGTEFEYVEGFNANGIVPTPDGSSMIIVNVTTGQLFRLDIRSGAATEIDTFGADLTGGDGLDIEGNVLYVLRNSFAEVVRLQLNADASEATPIDSFTSEYFMYPTTLALTNRGTVLVANSQFNARETADPELPFTVVEIPVPVMTVSGTPEADTDDADTGDADTGDGLDSDDDTDSATPVTIGDDEDGAGAGDANEEVDGDDEEEEGA